MKMRIKVVPNDEPNADGNWTTWSIPGRILRDLYSSDRKLRHEASQKIYGEMGPKGHHIVALRHTRKERRRIYEILASDFQRRRSGLDPRITNPQYLGLASRLGQLGPKTNG